MTRSFADTPIVVCLNAEDPIDGHPDSLPEVSVDPSNLAYVIYTSGSTGRPKGAIMTHRGMLWYVAHNQQHWPASPSG